jgi:hypothetical protein
MSYMSGLGYTRYSRFWACAVCWLTVACAGADGPKNDGGEAFVPESLLAKSWPVKATDEKIFGDYSTRAWATLTLKRDYCGALEQLGAMPDSDTSLAHARVHQDLSSVYRQASLISANSLIQAYAETPKLGDPNEVAHLLSVSYAIIGDMEKAKASFAKMAAVGESTVSPWHAPWTGYLAATDSPSTVQDAVSGLPVGLGPVVPGTCVEIQKLPHYSLKELEDSAYSVEMADPGALLQLAWWHDQASKKSAGEDSGMVQTYGLRYRLPLETEAVQAVALDNAFLMWSDFAMSEDAVFMADLLGEKGLAAIDEYKDKSLLSFIADASRVDGKINADKTLTAVAKFRSELLAEMVEQAGKEEGHFRTFAQVVEVGTLRNLSLIAQRGGDKELSGILRINAMEKSMDAAASPEGLLSLAAWDAGNRYPARGLEIIHQHIKRYPSLEAVRYGLDVFAVRVSRERSGMPGM